MTCPVCDFENMPDSEQCFRCGASLVATDASVETYPSRMKDRPGRPGRLKDAISDFSFQRTSSVPWSRRPWVVAIMGFFIPGGPQILWKNLEGYLILVIWAASVWYMVRSLPALREVERLIIQDTAEARTTAQVIPWRPILAYYLALAVHGMGWIRSVLKCTPEIIKRILETPHGMMATAVGLSGLLYLTYMSIFPREVVMPIVQNYNPAGIQEINNWIFLLAMLAVVAMPAYRFLFSLFKGRGWRASWEASDMKSSWMWLALMVVLSIGVQGWMVWLGIGFLAARYAKPELIQFFFPQSKKFWIGMTLSMTALYLLFGVWGLPLFLVWGFYATIFWRVFRS